MTGMCELRTLVSRYIGPHGQKLSSLCKRTHLVHNHFIKQGQQVDRGKRPHLHAEGRNGLRERGGHARAPGAARWHLQPGRVLHEPRAERDLRRLRLVFRDVGEGQGTAANLPRVLEVFVGGVEHLEDVGVLDAVGTVLVYDVDVAGCVAIEYLVYMSTLPVDRMWNTHVCGCPLPYLPRCRPMSGSPR